MLRVRRRLDVLDDASRRVLLPWLVVEAREPALGEFSRLFRALLGHFLEFRLRELFRRLFGLGKLRLAETHEAHKFFNTHAAGAVLVEPSP